MSAEEMKKEITLLTIQDVMDITGWSEGTVKKIMAQPDFPTIKIGKENQVLLESLKEFLAVRRDLRG